MWFNFDRIKTVKANYFNFKGMVPGDYTWKDAIKDTAHLIVPMQNTLPPDTCPCCGRGLVIMRYDLADLGDDGWQYMVHSVECPNYCGAYIDFA